MFKKLFVLAAIILLISGASYACRPFSVEDGCVLAKGAELELGYSGNTKGDEIAKEKGFVVNISLLPEKLQFGYERGYTDVPYHPWGAGDSVVSLKYKLFENQAIKTKISMIDGDELNGFGNEYTEYGITYALDNKIGNTTIFSSLGYTAYNPGDWYSDELVKNNWFLGFGIRQPMLNNLDLCLEATKQIVSGDYLDNKDGYVIGMIGLIWNIQDIPVDFSYRSNADSKDYTYAIGVTFGL